MKPEDKRHALKTAKKLGWVDPVPQSTLKFISMKRPIKRKWTNDVIRDFGKDRYGRTHLSKRHYLERERSISIDSDVMLS